MMSINAKYVCSGSVGYTLIISSELLTQYVGDRKLLDGGLLLSFFLSVVCQTTRVLFVLSLLTIGHRQRLKVDS